MISLPTGTRPLHACPEIANSDQQNDAVLDDATPLCSVASVSRSPVLPWESDCEDQVKEGIVRFSTDGESGKKKKRTRFWLKKKRVVNNVTKNLGDDSILKTLRSSSLLDRSTPFGW